MVPCLLQDHTTRMRWNCDAKPDLSDLKSQALDYDLTLQRCVLHCFAFPFLSLSCSFSRRLFIAFVFMVRECAQQMSLSEASA